MIWSVFRFPKKKVFHAPWEKLLDALIVILAGGTAMSELETRIRPDPAVQLAFGHAPCAHSSEIQRLLTACTQEQVSPLCAGNQQLYQQYGRARSHDFSQSLLMLDLDLTGLLTSKHAEGSAKGYFANHVGHYGRQLCRIIATSYDEILWQALLPGNTLSQATLKPAIQQAQTILDLSADTRRQTVLRWDAGFGTDKNINWMLSQGYQIVGKMYAHTRVAKLARMVTEWRPTLTSPGRELGLVPQPHRYARKTQQYVIRTPKKRPKNTWAYGVLVTTLPHTSPDEIVAWYDARGGGIETDFRSDRQGLGLAKRRKQGMAGQQMLLYLAERAHNLLSWTAHKLGPPLDQYGMLRLVRDAFQINGYVLVMSDHIVEIGLNRHHPLAYAVRDGFNQLLGPKPLLKVWEPIDYIKEH
jgi:hypothetical protein